VSKVERAIHVRIWKVAEPFWMILGDFCFGKTNKFRS
jgi:hypothetical protein